MHFLILGILVFFALRRKNSKPAYFFLMAFLVLLCAWCTESFDLINLQNMFEQPNVYHEDVAFGWDFYFNLCIDSSMSYTLFKAITSIITLLFLTITINKKTSNISFVLGLYALYLFMSQLTQIRNGLAAAIMIYSLTFLLDNKSGSVIKYLFWMFIAISVHYAMAFYLIFILIKIKWDKKTFNSITIAIILLSTALFLTNSIYFIMKSLFPNMMRITQYLNSSEVIKSIDEHSIKTIVIIIAQQIAFFALFSYISKCCIYDNSLMPVPAKRKTKGFSGKEYIMIYRMQILMFILLPFCLVSPTFFRLYRNTIIITYILAANALSFSKILKGKCRSQKIKIIAYTVSLSIVVWLLVAYMEGEGLMTLKSFNWGG